MLTNPHPFVIPSIAGIQKRTFRRNAPPFFDQRS
jgi:hypothetical protein